MLGWRVSGPSRRTGAWIFRNDVRMKGTNLSRPPRHILFSWKFWMLSDHFFFEDLQDSSKLLFDEHQYSMCFSAGETSWNFPMAVPNGVPPNGVCYLGRYDSIEWCWTWRWMQWMSCAQIGPKRIYLGGGGLSNRAVTKRRIWIHCILDEQCFKNIFILLMAEIWLTTWDGAETL